MISDDIKNEITEYIKLLDRSYPGLFDPGDEDDSGMEIRLQWYGNTWSIHTGDSSYDQDHRGHWGSTSIPWEESDAEFNPIEIMEELVEQVEESTAIGGRP